jgi:hypothetical protein
MNSGTRTQEHTRTQWFGAAKAAAFTGLLMLNIKETKNSKHGSALPYIRGTNVLKVVPSHDDVRAAPSAPPPHERSVRQESS